MLFIIFNVLYYLSRFGLLGQCQLVQSGRNQNLKAHKIYPKRKEKVKNGSEKIL